MRATLLLLVVMGAAMAAPAEKWRSVPLSFEPNTGQTADKVHYLARTGNFVLYLTDGGTLIAGRNQSPLRTTFAGAALSSPIRAEKRQASVTNYFIGNDPLKWRVGLPNYEQVRYAGVYPGTDLVDYGNQGRLEYDWIVAPGGDPSNIRMIFENAERTRIDKHGDLVIRVGNSEYRHQRPLVYQQISGKRVKVAGAWVLHGNEGRFRIGSYDRSRELVIDPPLAYSTYAGGSGLDWAYAVAVDSIGNTYVTGGSGSTNFPGGGTLKGTEDVSRNENQSGRHEQAAYAPSWAAAPPMRAVELRWMRRGMPTSRAARARLISRRRIRCKPPLVDPETLSLRN